MALKPQETLKEARDQLDLVMGFFARVDGKASVLLAINTGMLAVLASNSPPVRNMSLTSGLAAAFAILLIGGSLWFLYRVAFPVLSGGQQSLIFFREIANRTEARFVDDFIAQDDTARLKDLLGQVWRNSAVLKSKFDSVRAAFILMAIAIIPWVTALSIFSSQNSAIRATLLR
jgi:hypothetical protein